MYTVSVTGSCRGKWWIQFPGRCLSTAGGHVRHHSTGQPSHRVFSCVGWGHLQHYWHPVTTIPAQNRVTDTVEDSALHTKMENLEFEEEDDPRRVLWYETISWLGQIRPHHRDEVWSVSLWQAYFPSGVGDNIPSLVELPLSTCGCRKFPIYTFGDHPCTCTTHSGAKKVHDWSVGQIVDLFRTTHKVKTQQMTRSRGQ